LIDIHAHLLPGVDDGAEDMDMSLALLDMAARSGVKGIVATPHCNIPGEAENYASEELELLWDRLNEELENSEIPIVLYRGMEVYSTPRLPELLEQEKIWTLNDTEYVLLEFSFREDPDFCRDILGRCQALGYTPIVAHPERYFFLQDDPELAYEWCVSGCGLQLNKGSLLGRFGKGPQRTAELLVDHGLAACVASDAHSPFQRSTYMAELRDYLTEELGESYTRLLLEENPARILNGRELLGYEPIPFW
jgi:protein-tyrosine phosphatase